MNSVVTPLLTAETAFSIGNPVVSHSRALSPVYLLFPLANEISEKNPVEGGVSWRDEDLVSVYCSDTLHSKYI